MHAACLQGYERQELWDTGTWALLRSQGWRLPAFWSLDSRSGQLWVHAPEGSYRWQDVADCPAYVSLREAEAYCRLHGGRVMTEPEWEHLSGPTGAAAGVEQLDSGGWEWICTPLAPFPGKKNRVPLLPLPLLPLRLLPPSCQLHASTWQLRCAVPGLILAWLPLLHLSWEFGPACGCAAWDVPLGLRVVGLGLGLGVQALCRLHPDLLC